MTLLVQAANIRHAHGGNQIFEDVSFEVRTGDRVALVGENGSGKSTLFRIMARHLSPNGGAVTHARNMTLGFLSQESAIDPALSVRAAVGMAGGDPATLEARLRELEAAMGTAGDDETLTAVMDEYGALLGRLESSAGPGYDTEARVAETLAGLGLDDAIGDQPVGNLSGGEKKLVGLAQLLIAESDVLLLDEPDNHLDAAAKDWLDRYLAAHRGAVALISHDRWFIDRAVNQIFELEDGRIVGYPGNYSAYQQEKRARLERQSQLRDLQEREFKKLKASAEQLTQWARQNPKFASRAENQRRKMGDERARLDATPTPVLDRRRIGLDFATERGGNLVLEASGLAKVYGDRTVFLPFDLDLRHGERVGLVGPNGAGKTTLFKLILGQEPPTAGSIRIGPSIQVGYYAQEQETLNPNTTPLELARSLKPMTEQGAIAFLSGFLFTRDDALNQIANLSGGERARLQIAALILRGANFLLLDEPTNNLDLPSIEALETALQEFAGSILTISHDRYFLDILCGRIVELEDGVVRNYTGGFAYYDAHRGQGKELTRRPPPAPPAPSRQVKGKGKRR